MCSDIILVNWGEHEVLGRNQLANMSTRCRLVSALHTKQRLNLCFLFWHLLVFSDLLTKAVVLWINSAVNWISHVPFVELGLRSMLLESQSFLCWSGCKPKPLSWPLCLDVDMQHVSVGPAKKVVPSYAACNTMMQAAHLLGRWKPEAPVSGALPGWIQGIPF